MRRARGAGFWVALVLALLAAVLLVGGGRRVDGPPLDPRSTGTLGTRALVLLLEDLGARVEVAARVPTDEASVVLVLRDTFTVEQRDEVLRLVARGARLVVADPSSPLGASAAGVFSLFGPLEGESLARDVCDIGALRRVDRIRPSLAPLLQVGVGDQSCFGDGDRAFVVAEQHGVGWIVTLGGASILTNGELGDAGNATLAAALLAPTPGTHVVIAQPVITSEGDTTFLELASEQLGPGLPYAIVQLVVALLVYVAYRARRLGRPVPEPQPVQIAGSELVLAVGRLLHRTRTPEVAAAAIRARARLELCAACGLPPQSDPRLLAARIATRTSVDEDDVYRAVADLPVRDDVELLELLTRLDGIRLEVLDRGPTAAAR